MNTYCVHIPVKALLQLLCWDCLFRERTNTSSSGCWVQYLIACLRYEVIHPPLTALTKYIWHINFVQWCLLCHQGLWDKGRHRLQDSVVTHCPDAGCISAVLEDWRWVLLVSRVSCPWVYSLIPCWKHRQKLWPPAPLFLLSLLPANYCIAVTLLACGLGSLSHHHSNCCHIPKIPDEGLSMFLVTLPNNLKRWFPHPLNGQQQKLRGSEGCWCSWPPGRVYCPATFFSLLFIALLFKTTFLCTATHSCLLARCGRHSPVHNICMCSRHSPSRSFSPVPFCNSSVSEQKPFSVLGS